MAHVCEKFALRAAGCFGSLFCGAQIFLDTFDRGDIRTDGNILARLVLRIAERNDGRTHPVDASVLGPVLQVSFPHLSAPYGLPQVGDEFLGVKPGVDDAMVHSDQFFAAVLRDGTELFIHKSDGSPPVGPGHNAMLIQRRFQIFQFLQGILQM